MKRFDRRILSFSVGIALAGVSGSASAAFFQIQENNASGLGNAYAGGSAIAEDASTVWYNPAGMTRLSGSQVVVAGHFIQPSTKFNKESATNVTGVVPLTGGEGGDAGENALVPNLYYTHQVNNKMFIGLGVNAPFGLATDYDDNWVGRYHADRSEIMTINVNPSIAYRFNDAFSAGFGLNVQYIDAQLTQAIDFGLLAGVGSSQTADGRADINADDTSVGWNVGFLWEIQDGTRVGFAYRSKMSHDLKGTENIDAPGAAAAIAAVAGIVDTGARASVDLPATLSLSGYHKVAPQWAIMADVTQTRWSDLQELRIDFDSSQPDSVVTLNLKDVWRYSVGMTYMPNSAWTYKAGIALDKTPVPNPEDRSPRLPDEDRLWITVGLGYKVRENITADFAFAHIKVDDAEINKIATATNENSGRGNLRGTYEAEVNILSAQINWKF